MILKAKIKNIPTGRLIFEVLSGFIPVENFLLGLSMILISHNDDAYSIFIEKMKKNTAM